MMEEKKNKREDCCKPDVENCCKDFKDATDAQKEELGVPKCSSEGCGSDKGCGAPKPG